MTRDTHTGKQQTTEPLRCLVFCRSFAYKTPDTRYPDTAAAVNLVTCPRSCFVILLRQLIQSTDHSPLPSVTVCCSFTIYSSIRACFDLFRKEQTDHGKLSLRLLAVHELLVLFFISLLPDILLLLLPGVRFDLILILILPLRFFVFIVIVLGRILAVVAVRSSIRSVLCER